MDISGITHSQFVLYQVLKHLAAPHVLKCTKPQIFFSGRDETLQHLH